ncbi:MAG TPA: aspartate aminotransferase family protein [Chloroflexota bacterium]|jgi:adenosylmethionine-8-amino-7-oxononanoate aminotransferase
MAAAGEGKRGEQVGRGGERVRARTATASPEALRTDHLWAYNLQAPLRVATRGEGCYLYDAEGRRYLDGAAGFVVANLGHGNAEVADAMAQQARTLALAPFTVFVNEPALRLAARLARYTPGDLDHAVFTSGGSEAVEVAVKLARQYWVEAGQPSKYKIVGRWQSYHGNTLGTLAIGGNRPRRRPYAPLLVDLPKIPACYPYRRPPEVPAAEWGPRGADALEATILAEDPDTVAAFIAEPVVGATLGSAPAPPGYFQRIRQICDRYDVLFIADEVMTGFGRTGRRFGVEHWDVVPDLMAVAKGITAGYAPLGAAICTARVYEAFRPPRGSGQFVNLFTYGANPLCCAVGDVVLRLTEEQDLAGRADRVGAYLRRRLEPLTDSPLVGDVRGLGLMLGLEFVQDKATKEPFPPAARIAARVAEAALQRGLFVYPGTGTVDGERGDHLMVAPPLVITEAECDELAANLTAALDAVAGEL